MDRWDDDPDGEAERRRRRGSARDGELELSWDSDPDLFAAELEAEADALAAAAEVVPFEERYDPDELAAIDAGPRRSGQPVTTVSQWRRRSALGAVLTGMALGLQEVFDPEEERSIEIEVDADGEPLDLPVQMFLDPDSPAGSLCIVHASDNRKPPVV
ncbi:hypothetical protein HC251_08920 [Iamia sp. SCSIO 61187]|uniref:hypothetical protein n=1 Tax=Iamia sp. SCSIO 61187 TaxID=2722752 RepID=UPI001C62485A|nr:hypothetical protein [Iamia sp. SCSIO 61187]QYG92553.1 hypothetical protein HC251_08920 [Iamia sp. SCSIO 61187]